MMKPKGEVDQGSVNAYGMFNREKLDPSYAEHYSDRVVPGKSR